MPQSVRGQHLTENSLMESFLLYFQKRQACYRESHWYIDRVCSLLGCVFSATFMCYLLISPCPPPCPLSKSMPQRAAASLSFLGTISKITLLFFSSLSSGPLWSPGLFCPKPRLRNSSHYAPLTSPCQKEPEEVAGGGDDLWVLPACDPAEISTVPTSLPFLCPLGPI